MSKNQCSFQQLPFSKLFNTYVSDYSKLSDFYTANPFNANEVRVKAEAIKAPKLKREFIEALKEYHNYLDISESQKYQLD